MKRSSTDIDHMSNKEPSYEASKQVKRVKIPEDVDATALHIIRLNPEITATVEFMKEDLI